MDNGGLYPFDLTEYMKAISDAPPDTMIDMGDLQPQELAQCTECSAVMDWALTQYHDCKEGLR